MTVIAFDLDMTLIDSRPGIAAAMAQVSAESGHPIDTGLVTSRLGPPLSWELAHWMPADEVERWADRYREIYPDVAIPAIPALPGAREGLEAANRAGGSIVITAKHTPNARRQVDHLGLPAGAVFGDAWREQKAVVLTEQGSRLYVGDHVHDMDAARIAGVPGVGVLTGTSSADQLTAAGAAAVLSSLFELEQHLPDLL